MEKLRVYGIANPATRKQIEKTLASDAAAKL
jgi:hypothetical protein